MMGAYEGAKKYFSQPLGAVAKAYNYSKANVLLLEGKEAELKTQFPEVYGNLCSCNHHRDNRTAFAYGQDLVASWLMEDDLLQKLRTADFKLKHSGADKNREILANINTSTASDYTVIFSAERIRKLEQMNDYTGFWERNGVLHLRDNKYLQLAQEKSLLLAVSTGSKKFALYDFAKDVPATKIASHRPYGGKPAYALPIPPEKLHLLTAENLQAAIKNAA